MMPFIGMLANVGIFYLIARLVTKDPHLDFWQCLVWVLGAHLVGFVANLLMGSAGLMIEDPIRWIVSRVVTIAVLTVILWARSGFSQRQIVILMAFYAGWPFVIYGVIGVLSR